MKFEVFFFNNCIEFKGFGYDKHDGIDPSDAGFCNLLHVAVCDVDAYAFISFSMVEILWSNVVLEAEKLLKR